MKTKTALALAFIIVVFLVVFSIFFSTMAGDINAGDKKDGVGIKAPGIVSITY